MRHSSSELLSSIDAFLGHLTPHAPTHTEANHTEAFTHTELCSSSNSLNCNCEEQIIGDTEDLGPNHSYDYGVGGFGDTEDSDSE